MLFEAWARCLEEIERTSAGRDNVARRLAILFAQATPMEIDKLVNLCRGELRANPDAASGEVSVVDLLELPPRATPPTVEFVYKELIKICQARLGAREQRLGNLLASLGDLSARWVRRLLNDKSKPGVGEATILDGLAFAYGDGVDVRLALDHAYNSMADLGLVARLLWERGSRHLATVQPQVGIPVKPESQTRRRPTELNEIWRDFGSCFVHTKYDGYRCQIHKDGQSVKLFVGRSLRDWTGHFPLVVHAVQQQIEADLTILDSEIVPFDRSTGQVLPRKLFHKTQHHKAVIFDLIALDGEDWRNHPYAERHAKKAHIVRSHVWPRLIEYTEDTFVTSYEKLLGIFAECKEKELEGIIVIKPSALYQSNYSGLRSQECLKIKAVDPVDAVIVGYDLANKGRVPVVATFLVAVYDDRRDEFVTIGKVISGLKSYQRDSLHEQCVAFEVSSKPPHVNAKITPDRWVQPALVVELEVDYIYPSEEHTCGLAYEGIGYGAQNAKFLLDEIREDKGPEQATTVNEFLQIRREPGLTVVSPPLDVQATKDASLEISAERKQLSLF